MKMRYQNRIFTFLLIFFTSLSFSQSLKYEWAFNIGDSSRITPRNIAVDLAGNVYITGQFRDTVDFDPGPNTANLIQEGKTFYVAKYDVSGNYLWAFNISNISVSPWSWEWPLITVSNEGDIIIAGLFNGVVDFDPGPGTANLVSLGIYNTVFVAKYNTWGEYKWSFKIENSFNSPCIAYSNSKNFYISGIYYGTTDFDPGPGTELYTTQNSNALNFIAKYNSEGEYQWVVSFYGNGYSQYINLTTDDDDNIYATGFLYSENIDFDPGPNVANLLGRNIFVAKYNRSGKYQWAFGLTPDSSNFYFYPHHLNLAVDKSENIYLSGGFSDSLDLDPSPQSAVLKTNFRSIFLAKYNVNGEYQWSFELGMKMFYFGGFDLEIDSNDDVYISGYFKDTVDFDPGPGKVNLSSIDFNKNRFVAKYNQQKELKEVFNISRRDFPFYHNGTNGKRIIAKSGDLYIAGIFSDTADFDPGPGTVDLTAGGYSLYLAKYTGPKLSPVTVVSNSNINICENTFVEFIDSSYNFPEQWIWSFPGGMPSLSNQRNPVVQYINEGTYDVQLITKNAYGSDTLILNDHIRVYKHPIAYAGPDKTIIEGTLVQLNGTEIGNYTWWPSEGLSCNTCQHPTASPLETTTYYFTVANTEGCQSTDTITVFVEVADLFVPNVFSPNGDGTDDQLFVYGSFKSMEMNIYNRWGQLVFKTTDQHKGWDGTYLGKILDPAVFVYQIKIMDYKNLEFTRTGNITLVR